LTGLAITAGVMALALTPDQHVNLVPRVSSWLVMVRREMTHQRLAIVLVVGTVLFTLAVVGLGLVALRALLHR